MKLTRIILVILILFFLFKLPVQAGGGRILVYTGNNRNNYYYVGEEINVQAQVFKESPSTSDFSVGENVEFRVENPRPGDKCVTKTAKTTDLGMTNAVCTASTPGQILVYVHSLDDGYDSSRIVMYFYARPAPTATPVPPTSAPMPTAIPTLEPTAVLTSEPIQTSAVTQTTEAIENKKEEEIVIPLEDDDKSGGTNKLLLVILGIFIVGAFIFTWFSLKNKQYAVKLPPSKKTEQDELGKVRKETANFIREEK